MKNLIYILSICFALAACTSSTSTSSDPAPVQAKDSFPTPAPVDREKQISQNLSEAYLNWQKELAALADKKPTPENLKLAKEFLLGQALRNISALEKSEILLTVRADFKNRQGPQSEKDFLPLAKKILGTN